MALPPHAVYTDPPDNCATILRVLVPVYSAVLISSMACAERERGKPAEKASCAPHQSRNLHLGHLVMHRSQRMAFPSPNPANTFTLPYAISCGPLPSSRRRPLDVSYRLRPHLLADESTPVPVSAPVSDSAVSLPVNVPRPRASRRDGLVKRASCEAA